MTFVENMINDSEALLDTINSLTKITSKDHEIKSKENFTNSNNFIQIPRGSFLMGSNDFSDESPEHLVRIDYDFAINCYQVTVGEYLEFVKESQSNYPEWLTNRLNFKQISLFNYRNSNLSNNAPIVGVSWENAKEYCKWKSQKDGLMYRLPTEAEWEYVCRAGSKTKYCFGDDELGLKYFAWYDENAKKRAQAVGTRKANKWNIFDMHGNVWEWCEDVWNNNYDLSTKDGSANKIGDAKIRVLRGGSWADSSRYVRSSTRNGYDMDGCDNDLGFRLVVDGLIK